MANYNQLFSYISQEIQQAGLARVTLDRFKDAVLGAILKDILTAI